MRRFPKEISSPTTSPPMKRPLSTRINILQRLLAQSLEDINWLLDHFPEEEAKPYIEMLVKVNREYRASLRALGERLQAQRGWDFEV